MKECRILKWEQAEKKGKTKEKCDEKTTTVVAAHDDMFVFCDDGQVNIIHYNNYWVVDSGESYNITFHRHFFSTYTEGDFEYVRMENEISCKVIGMGDIYLDTDTGYQLILRNIQHVPDIRLNLISTGKLDDEGYHSSQGGGK